MYSSRVLRQSAKSPFITAAELFKLRSTIPVNATWFMPNVKRDAYAEHQTKSIPGAVFFDLDKICDDSSPFPHMLPKAEQFTKQIGQLGIKRTDPLCIYDTHGLFSAARVYWTFRVFGHQGAVSILQGGLPAWEEAKLPLARGSEESREPVEYGSATLNEAMVVEFDEIVKVAKADHKHTQILDARPHGRFTGSAPEPRPGLSSGHIPHSTSLPFTKLQSSDGSVLPPDDLKRVLQDSQVDLDRPVIVSCGTGVTACIVSVALETIGIESRVYDESWTGYADKSHAGSMDGMIIRD